MIKTNLITGALGSGKTTTIQHLLAHKPENEKWAVLVNEFGEIGIDGTLLANQGAVIKEIPGGCLCCVNGLPMQVGLNMLIKQARPDRLLIEPTGLGHPKQILQLLMSEVYRPLLELKATLCLLDARQLSDPRFIAYQTFQDQLASSDIIVANKIDRYQPIDYQKLADWQAQLTTTQQLIAVTQGQIPYTVLNSAAQVVSEYLKQDKLEPHNTQTTQHNLNRLHLPNNQGWRRALNQSDGYVSCGWIFSSDTYFHTARLLDWVRLAPVDRVKGVIQITEGTLIINRHGFDLHIETQPSYPIDSRIELIHHQQTNWNILQADLLNARQNQSK